jgi:hypothetical protein
MARMRTKLLLEPIGKKIWRVDRPFAYESDILPDIIVIPENFITDLISVPRLPLIYLLFGGIAREASAIHDWLYSVKCNQKCTKEEADLVFYELMLLTGYSKWKASICWKGVDLFGSSFFKQPKAF